MTRPFYNLAANIVTHLRTETEKIGHGHQLEGPVIELVQSILYETLTAGDSLLVHVPDATRGALITALATMPDEAFGWFVLACPQSAMTQGGATQIWPDGIGGFTGASRQSIEAVRAAAKSYMDQRQR